MNTLQSQYSDHLAQNQQDEFTPNDEQQHSDHLALAHPDNFTKSSNNEKENGSKSSKMSQKDHSNSHHSVSSRKSSSISSNINKKTKIISTAKNEHNKTEKEIEISDIPYRRSLILRKIKEFKDIINSQKYELRIAHIGIKELQRLFSKSIDENNELKIQVISDEKIKNEIVSLTKENAELHITVQENTGKIALLNEQILQLKTENEFLKKNNNFDLNSEYQEHIEKLSSEIELKDSLIEKFKKDVTMKNSFILSTRSIQSRAISLRNIDQSRRRIFSGSQFSDGSIEYSDAPNNEEDGFDGDDLEDIPTLNVKEQQMVSPKSTKKSIEFEEEEEEDCIDKKEDSITSNPKSFSSRYKLNKTKNSSKNNIKTNNDDEEEDDTISNEEEAGEEDDIKPVNNLKKMKEKKKKEKKNARTKSGNSTLKNKKGNIKSNNNDQDNGNEKLINEVNHETPTLVNQNNKKNLSRSSKANSLDKGSHRSSNADSNKSPKKVANKRRLRKGESLAASKGKESKSSS